MSAYNESDHPRDPRGQYTNKPGANNTSGVSLSKPPLTKPTGFVQDRLIENVDRRLIGSVRDHFDIWESIGSPEDDDQSDPIDVFRESLEGEYADRMMPSEVIDQWEKEGRPDAGDVDPSSVLRDATYQGLQYEFYETCESATDNMQDVLANSLDRPVSQRERGQLEDDAQRFYLEAEDVLRQNNILVDGWSEDFMAVRNGEEPTWWNECEDCERLNELARQFPSTNDPSFAEED